MALPKGFDVPFHLASGGADSPSIVEGNDALDRSIRTIVSTYPGERVYRPTFGCFARGNVFENMTRATAVQIASNIKDALRIWEPRISVRDVRFELDENTVYLTISWQPAGTQVESTTTIAF